MKLYSLIRVLNATVAVAVVILVTACDKPDPEQVRARQHLPAPGFVADAKQGSQLFLANCARCHGAVGKGTDQGPPLVHPVYRPGHHADLTFHWAVSRGIKQHHWQFGNMPPLPGVSPEEVGHIIAYVRAEQRKAGIN